MSVSKYPAPVIDPALRAQLDIEGAKLRELQAPRPSWKEALLPNRRDTGVAYTAKLGVLSGLGAAAAGGGVAALGHGLHTERLGRVGGGIAVAGAFALMGGAVLLGGMVMSGSNGTRESPEFTAQQRIVDELSARVYPEPGPSPEQFAAERLIAPYDHDGDGVVSLAQPSDMLHDERVRRTHGPGPMKDRDEAAMSAVLEFERLDTDHDKRLTRDEAFALVAPLDADHSGTVSEHEQFGFHLQERKIDDYRDYNPAAR
ncbi:MAG: hypothetical protein JWM98_2788 [Thermoleophilia bacterium]|nr:hypothetical protein [Thermoleophilia bacterium]